MRCLPWAFCAELPARNSVNIQLSCWRSTAVIVYSWLLLLSLFVYLALTAHLVALGQALLLCGAHGLPRHDEVAQRHMHLSFGLSLP